MGSLIQGDLVRHEKLGIGRVEETSGAGDIQQCTVYFPRTGRKILATAEELQLLTDEETAAYAMMKLAVYETSREDLPKIELGARWQGGALILKPGDPKLDNHIKGTSEHTRIQKILICSWEESSIPSQEVLYEIVPRY